MKKINENKNQDVRKTYYNDDPDNPQQLPIIIDQIHNLVGITKINIFQIGKLLTEAKALVGHGKFEQWIEDNFDFSYPTANNFMNVYKTCLQRPNLAKSIPASVLYTISSPKFPTDLREHLFEHGHNLSKINNPQIKNIMKQFKNKKIDFKSPEIKGLIQYREENINYKNYKIKIDRCLDHLRQLEEAVAKLSSGIIWPSVPDKENLEMTEKQMEKLKDIKKDLEKALSAVFPKADIVQIIKPSVDKTISEMKALSAKK